jgi:hypothetical protein
MLLCESRKQLYKWRHVVKFKLWVFRQYDGNATLSSEIPHFRYLGDTDKVDMTVPINGGAIDPFWRRNWICEWLADKIGVPESPLSGRQFKFSIKPTGRSHSFNSSDILPGEIEEILEEARRVVEGGAIERRGEPIEEMNSYIVKLREENRKLSKRVRNLRSEIRQLKENDNEQSN